MASFSDLPNEVPTHIIECLFQNVKVNITRHREESVRLTQLDRPNTLRINAVNSNLHSIAMALIPRITELHLTPPPGPLVRWGINQYCAFLQQAPVLPFVVDMVILPEHARLHHLNWHWDTQGKGRDMSALFNTTFLRLLRAHRQTRGLDWQGAVGAGEQICRWHDQEDQGE